MLFATDIYGITDEFLLFVDRLSPSVDGIVVSPYEQPRAFKSEEEAYQTFQNNGGIEHYIQKVSVKMTETKGVRSAIGFSAGGAALYRASIDLTLDSSNQLILFYPRQIRHFLRSHLGCHCEIIFPYSESGIDLTPIIESLSNIESIDIQRVAYGHGFMNRLSGNYSEEGYEQFCRYIQSKLDSPMTL